MKSTIHLGIILIIGCCAFAPTGAHAQSNLGRHYIVVVISSESTFLENQQPDDPAEIHLIAPRATTVRVKFSGRPEFVLDLPAGVDTTVGMAPLDLVGVQDIGLVTPKGITIDSDDSIFVSAGIVPRDEGDAHAPMPVEHWGSVYRIPSNNGNMWSAIIGATDATHVTITSACGGSSRAFTLNAGQVYLFADSNEICEPLVVATHPVGVVGCGIEKGGFIAGFRGKYVDNTNLTEQFLSVDKWGTEFYSMPYGPFPDSVNSPANQSELLHFVAHFPQTQITIDDTVTFTLAAGRFQELPVTGFHHIRSTQPILVAQYRKSCMLSKNTDNICGPRLTVIPAVTRYANDVWFDTPHSFEWDSVAHMIDIVYPARCIDEITLDGRPMSYVPWRPIGPDNTYFGTRIIVGRGKHHLKGRFPFGVIAYGVNKPIGPDSYAYAPAFWTPANDSICDTLFITAQQFASQRLGEISCATMLDTAVTITNITYGALPIDSIVITGADSDAFTTTASSYPLVVDPNGAASNTVRVPMRFTPKHLGISTAVVNAYSNDWCHYRLIIPISAVKDSIGVIAAPVTLDLGNFVACDSSTVIHGSFTLRNIGTGPVVLTRASLRGSPHYAVNTTTVFTLPPRESVSIPVVFTSSDTGEQRAVYVVRTQCNDSAAVIMRAHGILPAFVVGDAAFGAVCPGDSTTRNVIVQNTSVVPIKISDAAVALPFSIVPGQLPRVIPPGDSLLLAVRYAPLRDGADAVTIRLAGAPCSIAASAVLTGERGTPMITADNVDFGTVCVGGSSYRTLDVRNTGNATVRIDAVACATYVTVQSVLPIYVPQGEAAHITLSFAPQSPVAYRSQVRVNGGPCGVITIADINGAGVAGNLAASGVVMDTVNVGAFEDSVLYVYNHGVQVMTVDTLVVTACDSCPFIIGSLAAFTIAPGDSHRIAVRYTPAHSGSDTISICVVVHAPCYDSLCITAIGHARTDLVPMVHLCVDPFIQRTVGDTVLMHVNLPDVLPPTPFDSVRFDIVYDRNSLRLVGGVSSACTSTSRSVAAGRMRVTMAPCTMLPQPEIYRASFIALVSIEDTARTTIAIDSIRFFPQIADGAGCIAQVTILPVCGLHGIVYRGAPSLSPNYPNPFSGNTSFTLSLSPDDRASATLRVYDVYGRVVNDLTTRIRANAPRVEFNAASVASGIYTGVLETATARVTRVMMVMR